MNYIHSDFQLSRGDVIEFNVDRQANVRVMDDVNYRRYRARQSYEFLGGAAKRSPVRIAVPRSGRWHGVVDLGGHTGRVQARINAFAAA